MMEAQSQYPPPASQNQMPQWARNGQLDKSRYPKTITKDQLIPMLSSENSDSESMSGGDRLEDQNPAIRVEYLERSIKFLKAQHQDILSSLHAEIEKLRNDNKDLHFKLVMRQREVDAAGLLLGDEVDMSTAEEPEILESYLREKTTERQSITSGSAKSKAKVLEHQITELRHQIRELKNKNEYLSRIADRGQQHSKTNSESKASHSGAQSSASGSEISINMENITSNLKSVMIHDRTGSARRHPNAEELERIVLHMHRLTQQQEIELTKVKSDLKEVLYSKKWTPDAYLLAKAYVASDGAPAETDILPKLRSTTRKLPDLAYITRDNVSLPALKNTMGTKAAERRKRTQILQKARLHKEVS